MDTRTRGAEHRDDADRLISRIADSCALRAEWVRPDAEERWCKIPVQDGLAFECTLQLVNDDELWFNVGGFFTLSCFPFAARSEDFRKMVVDFLAGRSRIRLRFGCAVLERPAEHGWKVEARYSGLTWYGWRERIVFSDGDRVW